MSIRPVVVVLHDGRAPRPQALAPVSAHAEIRYCDESRLAGSLAGAQVLFVHHFLSNAVPDAWHAADSLQWLHIAAAGVDPVMFPELRASDVVVTNSRGIFDVAIAEYVLAQLLSFAKDLPGAWQLQRSRTWQHTDSQRLAGSTALVVGTGPIGRAIARLLRAVGVEVRGAGRRARTSDPDFTAVAAPEDLTAELARADWVIAAAPLTDLTRHLFDADAFAAMRPGARFINVGRGELVRTPDLLQALRSGTIAGAALDVLDPEPLPREHPLWEAPNVVITAHRSGDVLGWREELVALFAENFQRWITGATLINVVDKNLGYVPSEGAAP
jgi:phosphoglycerate dehydrogenase-like enzyme